jgi:hypothetical protein
VCSAESGAHALRWTAQVHTKEKDAYVDCAGALEKNRGRAPTNHTAHEDESANVGYQVVYAVSRVEICVHICHTRHCQRIRSLKFGNALVRPCCAFNEHKSSIERKMFVLGP